MHYTHSNKLLTAYNGDVQRYIQGSRNNKIRKETILSYIEGAVLQAGKSFEKLFTNKKRLVLDEILFLSSGKGVCKIGADKLAEKTGVSVRTVYGAVKALKETGEVLVCRLANNQAGKYVFVLKNHPNFQEILKEVFHIASLPVEEAKNAESEHAASQNAEHIAGQFAGLENAESLDTQEIEGEKPSSNHINLNIFKQEKNIIQQSIENELENGEEVEEQKELERVNTYYVNEIQKKVYHEIKFGEYHKELKASASVIGLRVGSNAERKHFFHAMKAVFKVNRFLLSGGTVQDSVPALFSRIYNDNVKLSAIHKTAVTGESEASEVHTREIPFYNWLEKDGSVKIPAVKAEVSATKEELNELGIY